MGYLHCLAIAHLGFIFRQVRLIGLVFCSMSPFFIFKIRVLWFITGKCLCFLILFNIALKINSAVCHFHVFYSDVRDDFIGPN